MQHLDEGTIHAWLDGALTPEEAAQADAHVKDCPQCQAAVAEARGFIAASSRILTALDDAPRGVIPVAPKQRVQPWVWRVAATVVVVATGTLLLVKDRGGENRVTVLPRQPAAADSAGTPRVTSLPATAPAAIRAMSPAGTVSGVTQAPNRPPSREGARAENLETRAAADARRVDAPAEVKSDGAGPAPTASVGAAARAPAASGRAFSAVAGAAFEPAPREVASKRLVGRTQTFYEIAPGDTVVLEEQLSPELQNVVVTGAAARSAQPQPTRRAEKAAAASVESQQKAPATAPSPAPAAALSDAQVGDRHSISWLDPSTRAVMILSGRHSQTELETIREQIQRLRVERSKKNPE